jgi:integrase
MLLECERPTDRLTRPRLQQFLEDTREMLCPTSLNQVLRDLRQAARLIAPETDWRWITRNGAYRSRARLAEYRRKRRLFDPIGLYRKSLSQMDELDRRPMSKPRAILYRDTLMAAFQCQFALRRKELSSLRIGEHLIAENGALRIKIGHLNTKTGATMNGFVDRSLKPYVFAYLQRPRPYLLAGRVTDAVWINASGSALDYGGVRDCLIRIGVALLGHPIDCHGFRYASATATIRHDPRNVEGASALLNHRSTDAVDQHYDLTDRRAACLIWDELCERAKQ